MPWWYTGEGRIEVCNAGGCVLIAGGESAWSAVPSNPGPYHDAARPAPGPPATAEQVVYATGETRSASGGLIPLSTPLPSGTNYAVAQFGIRAARPSSTPSRPGVDQRHLRAGFRTAGIQQFRQQLGRHRDRRDFLDRWRHRLGRVEDRQPGEFRVVDPLQNMHYVIGVPTSTTDMLSLAGITATFGLAGYTFPTTPSGLVGDAPVSGTLTAQFGGSLSTLVGVDMTVPVAGVTHKFSGTIFTSGVGPGFSGTVASCVNCSSTFINGFFAGQNASHAGLTYRFVSTPLGGTGGRRRGLQTPAGAACSQAARAAWTALPPRASARLRAAS